MTAARSLWPDRDELGQVIPLVVKAKYPAELRCWLGFMHNGTTGSQLINEEGGGISCIPLEENK